MVRDNAMSPLAYLNGRLLPFSEAALPLHDAGFVWGATVVDNCRTYGRSLFRWADHLARFRHDCAVCFIPLEISDRELTASAERLIAANHQGHDLQLVTFATPGPLGQYLGEHENGPPTVGMVTYPVPVERNRHFETDGVVLAAALNPAHRPDRLNSTLVSPTVKHRSRMAWWIAERAKTTLGFPPDAVPLFFDRPDGTPTETSHANLIAITAGRVVTPPRHLTLDGISLRVVEELCASLGMEFTEGRLDGFRPPAVSEVMLAGTSFGLVGVRAFYPSPQVDPIRFTWPGPIYHRLRHAWDELVARECRGS
jgi:branched-chain amino acid aminotransferase